MRKKVKKKSAYSDEALLIQATVSKIIEIRISENGNTKNSFECPAKDGTPVTCISWGYNPNLKPGCSVLMKGRFKPDTNNKVFLAWSIQITPKDKENE